MPQNIYGVYSEAYPRTDAIPPPEESRRRTYSYSGNRDPAVYLDLGMGTTQAVTWTDFKEYVDGLESKCITLAMLVADKIASGDLK